jgi:hypothetical protein
MSCQICTESFYTTGAKYELNKEKCSYIADSGKKCSSKSTVTGLCGCHEKERTPIQCPDCNGVCCKVCYRTFFLSKYNEPSCVHCKKTFDLEFLITNFSHSFVFGAYRNHREDVLYDQVMAKMTEYKAGFSIFKRIDVVEKKYKQAFSSYKKDLNNRCRLLYFAQHSGEMIETEILENLANFEENLVRAQELHDLRVELTQVKSGSKVETDTTELVRRGHCPVSGCIGFIRENWKCNICEIKICRSCKEIKTKNEAGEHECDPEILESVKLIAKNSKKCPNCIIPIQKSEGCNQMWCTNCRIFFDWKTGEKIVETAYVHNPHYNEWRNAQPRVFNENYVVLNNVNIDALTIGDINVLNNIFHNVSYRVPDIDKHIRRCVEILDHLDNERIHGTSEESAIRNYVYKFLDKSITLDKLKSNLHRIWKSKMKTKMLMNNRFNYCKEVSKLLYSNRQIDTNNEEDVNSLCKKLVSLREIGVKSVESVLDLLGSTEKKGYDLLNPTFRVYSIYTVHDY